MFIFHVLNINIKQMKNSPTILFIIEHSNFKPHHGFCEQSVVCTDASYDMHNTFGKCRLRIRLQYILHPENVYILQTYYKNSLVE